jgi:hypothetical protein
MGGPAMLMAALAAASTAAQISEKHKAAQAEGKAANARTMMMYKQRESEQEEIKAAAGAKLTDEERKRTVERGKVRAMMSETGLAGISSIRELANTYMQSSFEQGSIISKEEAELRSSGKKAESDYLLGKSKVNEANSKIGSPLSTVLQIGSSAAMGYASGGGFSEANANTAWYSR